MIRQLLHECSVTPGEQRLIHVSVRTHLVHRCVLRKYHAHSISWIRTCCANTRGVCVPSAQPITAMRCRIQPIGARTGGARQSTSSILVTVNAYSRGRAPRVRQLAYRCPQSVRDTA
ncbi:hypothetical protein CBL_01453 [Carabus blaptoides fortunei]